MTSSGLGSLAHRDLVGVLARWRATGLVDDRISDELVVRCVETAEALVAQPKVAVSADDNSARFCVVTKHPHATSQRALSALLARLLAFGVQVHGIHRLATADHVAKQLYPVAYAHFKNLPEGPTTWSAIDSVFGTDRFRMVFGTPYSRELVMTGSQVMSEFGVTDRQLMAIWEEGRRPIGRSTLIGRYGTVVANTILSDADRYTWFRGEWPLGIHRISSGTMAFALRDERLGGEPLIILNGHFLGLADLFGPGTAVIEAGIAPGMADLTTVRRWVIGDDNRPAACAAGSVRRDALDAAFPTDSAEPVDSRCNVVHCSDGLLAGMIECATLMGWSRYRGMLAKALLATGLTTEELHHIVAASPLIRTVEGEVTLVELTRGQPLEQAVGTIARMVPPVFGAANGYASGLRLPSLVALFDRLVDADGDLAAVSHRDSDVRNLSHSPVRLMDVPPDTEQRGTELIARGAVGCVVPAGGTGGRFGGYDLPESDPRRQKALIPVLQINGAQCCGLDVRLANASFWARRTGGRVPLAVLAGPTNRHLVEAWRAGARPEVANDVVVYQQYGSYRFYADAFGNHRRASARWVDAIARGPDGAPSLKPPGNLGMLTCLVLSGVLEAWARDGVEILAIANGDDAGFRLDPRIIGMFGGAGVDAVAVGVPWGVRGRIASGGGTDLRGDVSGWCQAASGASGALAAEGNGTWVATLDGERYTVDGAKLDVGGCICEIRHGGAWRVGIAETTRPDRFSRFPAFSTNHLYIRISSLCRSMGLAFGDDPLGAVTRFVAAQPAYVERKLVPLTASGDRIACAQVSQGANDVLRHLSVRPVLMSRRDGRSGYAALKEPSDVRFAQMQLDALAEQGDELEF